MKMENQRSNDNKTSYKFIKRVKGTRNVDVLCKSFSKMPPKLELLNLRQELNRLIKVGVLNASIDDLSGSDFKLSFVKNGVLLEIYYELIEETEYSTAQYDPMI